MLAQALHLIGMAQQGDDTVTDQVARGLVASDQQECQRVEQFFVR